MTEAHDHRRWSRHRLAYVLTVSLCILYASFYVFRMASALSDENLYRDSARGVVIISITPGGASDKAGLHVGDVITAINGVPVRSAMEANRYLIEASRDRPLYYTVLRNGKTSVFTVHLASFGLPLVVLFLLVSGGAFLALGIMVMVRRPGIPVARLFAWVMLGWGVFFAVSPSVSTGFSVGWIALLRPQVLFISWMMMMGGTIHLLFHFPSPRFSAPLPHRFLIFVYANSALWLILSMINSPFPRGLSVALAPVFSVAIVEFIIAKKYRHLELRRPREQMRMLLWAGLSGAWFLAAMALDSFLPVPAVMMATVIAVPVILFLMIARFRAFDLYVLGRRTQYLLSLSLLHVSTVALFFLGCTLLARERWNLPLVRIGTHSVEIVRLSQLPDEDQPFAERTLMVMGGAVLAGLLWWSNGKARGRVAKTFHRQAVDYRRALQEFSRLSLRFSDRGRLAQAVVETLRPLMQVRGARMLWRDGDEWVSAASEGEDLRLPGGIWSSRLDALTESRAAGDPGWKDLFQGTGVDYLTPIRLQDRTQGLLLLGAKDAETNFTKTDVELLNSLARHVAAALETMDLYVGVREQERMRKELDLARRIQLSSLPADIPDLPSVEIAVASQPAMEVGGDFYDFIVEHPEVTFFVGDVSGKGMSAALHLSHIQGILHALQPHAASLWELFVRVNTQVLDRMDRSTFITMSALRLDLLNKQATLYRAGHPPLLHYRAASGDVIERRPSGIGIGLHDRVFGDSLVEETFVPSRDDVLVLFSDGLIEAFHPNGDQFGVERVGDVLREASQASSQELRDRILAAVDAFTGVRERHDDLTLLVIRFL